MPTSPASALPLVDLPCRVLTLPEHTTFLEAACTHPKWRARTIYVPVTSESHPEACGLYALDLDLNTVSRVADLPGGALYYGCKVTPDGQLYVCRAGVSGEPGTILAIDLSAEVPTARTLVELPAPAQPNDLDIDLKKGKFYVATNDQRFDALTERGQVLNTLDIAARGGGRVYVVDLNAPAPAAEVYARGLRAVAGIAVVRRDAAVWVSELHNLVRIPLVHPAARTRVSAFDARLLADNLDAVGDELVFPYYREIPGSQAAILQSRVLARIFYGLIKVSGAGSTEPAPSGTASDVFEDIRFARYNLRTWTLSEHRLRPDVPDFDGHCTHVEKVGSSLVFINYIKRDVLIADASRLFGATS